MEVIPLWVAKLIKPDQLPKISEAVGRAEKSTSGEIVPMIVRSSTTVGHVPGVLFLGSLLILWTLAGETAHYFPQVPWWAFEVGVAILAARRSLCLSGFAFWQRLLTSPHDQAASVHRRAQLEFYQSNIKASHRHTGVLIFVSLLERRAVILADEPVAKQIPEDIWEQIVHELLAKIKQGDFTGGMCHAIETVGAVMREKFPIHVGDRNELSNELVIKD